jgi:hypothetical protein
MPLGTLFLCKQSSAQTQYQQYYYGCIHDMSFSVISNNYRTPHHLIIIVVYSSMQTAPESIARWLSHIGGVL